MSQHYNQNHSRKEIETVLNEIKNCVSSGKYIISQNDKRQENIDFINEYNIRTEKQKSILMQINVEDFCYTLQNTKLGYEYEVLYNSDGDTETVDIYTKFNIIDIPNGRRTIVISFHKRNKPITYLFR